MIREPRHVILAGAVVLASWLVSTATSRPQPPAPAAPRTSATRPSSRDVALDSLARDADHETTRLRERLADAPTPRRSGRPVPLREASRAA
jgi:hypothetical protein